MSVTRCFVSCYPFCVLMFFYFFPCQKDEFIVETDASASGVGGVLSVRRRNRLLPVVFYSRRTTGLESRYLAQELEGLALFATIRNFSFYLYGCPFVVITDHKGLVDLMTRPQMNKLILRWALKLTEYSFSIEYRPGRENQVADALSRSWMWITRKTPQRALLERGGGVVGVSSTCPQTEHCHNVY